MQRTSIEWTDFSSNPIYATVEGKRGWFCEKVSPGCAHCYSASLNKGRFGNGLDFLARNRPRVEFHLNEKELLEWQKPKYAGKRCFPFDMTDLFGDWVSDEWLDRIFAAMALSPQLTFQVLTKRPERMRAYFADPEMRVDALGEAIFEMTGKLASGDPADDDQVLLEDLPLPNVWLGVSAENQHWADERIPILLDTPAAVRFISAEPLLGPLNLTHMDVDRGQFYQFNALTGENRDMGRPCADVPHLDWIVVGGESGSRHRPFAPEWARSIVSQTREANRQLSVHGASAPRVAMFIKQLGGFRPGTALDALPSDLRVREYPDERTLL